MSGSFILCIKKNTNLSRDGIPKYLLKKLSKNFVYIDIFYNFFYITIKIKCL